MEYRDYEIHTVVANKENGTYGDVYISLDECKREHPNEKYMFGFYVSSYYTETPDWFNTIQEAIDWIDKHPIEVEKEYCPSSTHGDYSPSCPWNAPGMSIGDFI